MNFKPLIISALVSVQLVACQEPKVSVSDSYDGAQDKTTLSINPFGEIVIPGRWTPTWFEESNNSQELVDSNETILNVTFIPKKYSLFPSIGLNDREFVVSAYQLESDGCLKSGYTSKIVAEDPNDNYIMWMLSEDSNKHYLIGAKSNNVYIFTISSGTTLNKDSLSQDEKINFLKNLYLEN